MRFTHEASSAEQVALATRDESPLGAAGSLEPLAAQYEAAYGDLWRQALGVVGSSEIAKDIVHQAFADTAARIKAGTEIRNLGAWLRTVVRNQCMTSVRRAQRESTPLLDLPDDVVLTDLGHTPPDAVHMKQRCEAVYRAIDGLAPAQRSALILAELRGLNYREIAESLGRTEGAVRDLLCRARTRVREAVGPDVASVIMPIANLEVAGRLAALKGQARGLRDYILAKIADLQTSMASLFQRTADIVGQPVAPLATAALVVATLGASPAGPPAPAVPGAAVPPAVAARAVQHESDRSSAGGTRPAAPRAVGGPPAISLFPAPGGKPRPATDTGGTPPDDKRPKHGPADKRPAGEEVTVAVAVAPVAGTPASGGQPGTTEPPPPPAPFHSQPGDCDTATSMLYCDGGEGLDETDGEPPTNPDQQPLGAKPLQPTDSGSAVSVVTLMQ